MIDYDETIKDLEENFDELSEKTDKEQALEILRDIEKSVENLEDTEQDVDMYDLPEINAGEGLIITGNSISVNDELMRDISLLKSDSLLRKDKYKLQLVEYFLLTYKDSLDEKLKTCLHWDKEDIEDFIEGRKQFDVDEIKEMEDVFHINIYDLLTRR